MNQVWVLGGLILIFIFLANPIPIVRAADVFELIDIYRDALDSGHADAIAAAKEAVRSNVSVMNYMRANDPELFAKLDDNAPSEGAVLVGSGNNFEEPAYSLLDDDLLELPELQERMSENLTPNKIDNQTFANDFRNQNRPSNMQLMKQQLRQYDQQLRSEAEEGAIFVTVSGVGEGERETLARILKTEISGVESVREKGFNAGLVNYLVRLDGVTPETFAYSLDNRRLGSFVLDMTRFRPEQIDFILKF